MEAFKRLFEAALRGGKRGWNHDDPVGYNPETLEAGRQVANNSPYGIGWIPQGLTEVSRPFVAAGDTALRGANSVFHGGAALAGQAAHEIGIEPAIGTRDINVYANVLKKFQEKRIGLDGMTPDEVAQSIYRVVHGKGTVAERGNFPTAQRLVNETRKPADLGFVGRGLKDDVSVKSVFRADAKELERQRKTEK